MRYHVRQSSIAEGRGEVANPGPVHVAGFLDGVDERGHDGVSGEEMVEVVVVVRAMNSEGLVSSHWMWPFGSEEELDG